MYREETIDMFGGKKEPQTNTAEPIIVFRKTVSSILLMAFLCLVFILVY